MRYSTAFKAKMVQKMTGPAGMSARALAQDVGLDQTTLSRWLREAAATVQPMDSKQAQPEVSRVVRRPQDFTAQEKLAVVLEAASVPEHELGEFLRRKGLHQAHLNQWRAAALDGLQNSRRSKKAPGNEAKRIRALEKELRRKDKALAETAALLILKKKALAIWGDEDDDTNPRSGK